MKMHCSVVVLMGLVMLSRKGISLFLVQIFLTVLCAIKAINCLSDVLTVRQNLLFNCEHETVTAQRISFGFPEIFSVLRTEE